MRLSVNSEAGVWRLEHIRPDIFQCIRQAADDATSDSEAARERLHPKPVAGDDEIIEAELVQDWREIVSPELEHQFATDVGTMMADLDAVREEEGRDDEGKPLLSLDVPIAHAAAWFSALNQARLMLDQRHGLHTAETQSALERFDADQIADPAEAGRLRLIFIARARYEFFSAIQEWLVRNLLAAGR